MKMISPVRIDLVASESDSSGRPKTQRTSEIEAALLNAVESGKMDVTFEVPDGERYSGVASCVRSTASRMGVKAYVRKHNNGKQVKVLVMGRL